jgi:ornithine carbamoyltransferase
VPPAADLRQRSFIKELDLRQEEFLFLLGLAADLKAAKRAGTERRALDGKNLVLLFEKTSTRTRCAFEVAAHDQGAHVSYLDPSGSHLGHKESVADTARVLGRMYDAIGYRGSRQAVVEELAARAGIPVYNALTDTWHPTQMLADMLTMSELSGKPLQQVRYAYLGDARHNMGNSLAVTGALLGMDVRIVAPEALWPGPEVIARSSGLAAVSGGRVTFTEDVAEGVRDADFVHTDVWVSLGEPAALWAERIAQLKPYQVNADVLAATGNPRVRFMHCLPAFHDRSTAVGEEIYASTGMDGLEVTDEVFESPASAVFDQAENRMHTIKALLVATLGPGT